MNLKARGVTYLQGLVLFALTAGLAISSPTFGLAREGESRWEDAIKAFEAVDRENPPPKHGVLFVGSSSIRMWKLENYFDQFAVINRGFGGSQISDSVQFADRIVLPHAPSTIVFYAGDNDIAAGKSPQQVAADFKTFARHIHAALPGTPVLFIAIKPSLSRWALIDKIRETNALIRKFTRSDERLIFVDIDGPMLGEDGKPRGELFVSDGLHLSAKGYELWTRILTPRLEDAMGVK